MAIKYAFLAISLVVNLTVATANSLKAISVIPSLTRNSPLDLEAVPEANIKEIKEVWVTAYSSTPEETDDTPFLTASGSPVRDGVVATNMLPFGTKIKIPEVYGDKVFVVEDRMHSRKVNFVDVWMPSKEEATRMGIAYTKIQVLE